MTYGEAQRPQGRLVGVDERDVERALPGQQIRYLGTGRHPGAAGLDARPQRPRQSNDAIDKSHGLIFDSTTGNSSIVMSHQDGQSVVLAKDKGSISLTASDGEHSLNVATDGVSIAAKNGTKIVGGNLFSLPHIAFSLPALCGER